MWEAIKSDQLLSDDWNAKRKKKFKAKKKNETKLQCQKRNKKKVVHCIARYWVLFFFFFFSVRVYGDEVDPRTLSAVFRWFLTRVTAKTGGVLVKKKKEENRKRAGNESHRNFTRIRREEQE